METGSPPHGRNRLAFALPMQQEYLPEHLENDPYLENEL